MRASGVDFDCVSSHVGCDTGKGGRLASVALGGSGAAGGKLCPDIPEAPGSPEAKASSVAGWGASGNICWAQRRI
jgi:hypothetical protein